jgi:sugar-specific transcriptional regulator TrmB
MEDKLKKLGFKDNEIKIYLFLAKNPSSLASEIAKKTNLYRPHAYDILERLIEKGLVLYVIKSGKKYFSATSPEKIITEIDLKEENLEKQKKIAEDLIPQLKALFSEKQEICNVEVFEGKEGLKSYYEFVLKLARQGKVKEIYSLGGKGDVFRTLEFYFPHILKRAIKEKLFEKLKYYMLWDNSKKNSREHIKFKKHLFFRFLSKERSVSSGFITFLDYLIIAKITQPAMLIRIKNKELADSFKQIFLEMWKNTKP